MAMAWRKYKKQFLLVIGALLLMIGVCVALYDPMMQLFARPEGLKKTLTSYGIWGQIGYALIMSMQVVFVFLPGEIVEVMAGFLYGPFLGMCICLLGTAIGSSFIYLLVDKWGVSFLHTFIKKEKCESFSFLKKQERLHMAVFLLFFIPGTPKDIVTYFIPLTSMRLSSFLFLTTLARIPSVLTSTVAGNAIGEKDYFCSILIFAVTGALSLLGMYAYKRYEKRKKN